MIRKKLEDFNLTEQDLIKAYRKHKFITELEELDWDNLDDDMYMKIMIFVTLSTNEGSSWVDNDNIEHSFLNGELISKEYQPKENKNITKKTQLVIPEYVFERIEYQREVIVEGKKGIVTDWEEYINGQKYYDYPLDSYERKNWRFIEYQWKNYIKELNK